MKRARLGAAVVVLSLGAASPLGCRQVLAIDEGACGELSLGADDCDGCTVTHCCALAAACDGDAGCSALFDCLATCGGDDACRAGCRAGRADTFGPAAAALASCQAQSCDQACALSCGGYVYPTADCAACGAQQCCGESLACSRDAACMALGACQRGCSEASDYYGCLGECVRRHPGGETSARALAACLGEQCTSVCGDPAWTCAGGEEPTVAPFADMGLHLRQYPSDDPLVGAVVTLCDITDASCSDPLATDTTGEDGRVAFEDAPLQGRPPYFRVEHELIYPALIFVSGEPVPESFSKDWALVTLAVVEEQAPGALAPDKGHAILSVLSCNAAPPAGAHFDSTPESPLAFYLLDGLVVPALPDDASAVTDYRGIGGLLNLPPGPVTVRAYAAATGALLRTAQIRVEAAHASYVSLDP